ncbi:YMGG-like glycine zipper-containing protein [Halovivax gelatinilyticus]|uniref:YMGG-like glycine zipper-containing protein n=1 Tax=Halovivax gelatinilyticus TaxID=2961597 RepID=UPI0020CA443F|nr:YMGG-like glycine zipper-containing protein [Halovivax gelatinilyticus]
MVRDTLTLALSRARYAAIGAAVGAGLGGLFSRSAASSGAALGALVGAFVGESRVTTKKRIEEWRDRGQERVEAVRGTEAE